MVSTQCNKKQNRVGYIPGQDPHLLWWSMEGSVLPRAESPGHRKSSLKSRVPPAAQWTKGRRAELQVMGDRESPPLRAFPLVPKSHALALERLGAVSALPRG